MGIRSIFYAGYWTDPGRNTTCSFMREELTNQTKRPSSPVSLLVASHLMIIPEDNGMAQKSRGERGMATPQLAEIPRPR